MDPLLKSLGTAFFSFAQPRIKNSKVVRDFRKRWLKDNYALKTTLMFKAGVDDAKALLELPEGLIKELLEDISIRNEIFRWIIEGVSYEDFSDDSLELESYFENYPDEKEKIIPFLKLILDNIIEYKEIHWDPEILNILNGIDVIKNEMRNGFYRLKQQQVNQENKINENMQALFENYLGSVGFEDLQELLNEGKIITARKKAEERLKHAKKSVEKLELNALIANSYLCLGYEKEAIPFLYGALAECEDNSRKNRLNTLIHLINNELDQAGKLVELNIQNDGYTEKNVQLLLNIFLQQRDYETGLSLLDKHPFSALESVKANILLSLSRYEEVIAIAERQLEEKPDSKEWLLIKADATVLKMELSVLNGGSLDPKQTLREVIMDLETIEKENENSRQLQRVKALKAGLYFRNKQFRQAAVYFHELYSEEPSKENEQYFNNAIWSYFQSGDIDSAIKLLEQILAEGKESPQYEEENAVFLARLNLSEGSPYDAIKVLETFFDNITGQEPMDYYFVKLEALFLLLKTTEMESFIKEVEQNISITIAYVLQGFLAFLKHDWDEACDLFNKAIENKDDDDTAVSVKPLLIDAYMNRGKKEDQQVVIKLITTLKHWKQHERLVRQYIEALYNLGDYAEILNFYHNESNEPPVFLQEVVAAIYSENKWFDKSKEMFQSLYHKTQNIKFLIRFAECLFHLGQTQECFNTLSFAEKKIQENASVQDFNLMTHAYKTLGYYEKALEFAYKTFKLGQDRPEVWRSYFSEFIMLSTIVPEEIMKKEYIDAYHEVLSQFNKKFPDERPPFEQYKVIEEGGGISEEFINKLKEISEGQAHLVSVYNEHRMSLEMFRQLTNKKPFELWASIINQPNLHIWVNHTGSIEEAFSGVKVARKSRQVLCDLFSLFTLNYLDLLDQLSELYDLYITQEQYETLFIEYQQLRLSQPKGVQTIAYYEGNLVRDEATPEQVNQTIQLMDKILKWIDLHCTKVGSALISPRNDDEKELLNTIDDSLKLCMEFSYNMLVDSFLIKDYSKERYNVEIFSVVDLISSLNARKEISDEKFIEAIGKLIIIGYRYITAGEKVYRYFLTKNEIFISGETERLFDYLKEHDIHYEYAFSIIIDLLIWLWEEDKDNKSAVTKYLCELILNKTNGIELLEKLPMMLQEAGILEPQSIKNLNEIIRTVLN
ncbi:hypothetical protein SAMN05444673_2805 [Bacillus sp. OV166]|uniref:tetratricopeptide repeat protein n=1 Tax=Bacillus sp. OV166 TaxID=1882763 RepID=UPI000A2AA5B1|nr:hypothetical protein [Bacillus sp. OV166]SMQ77477.1 hypothetical protein SAMN05444673_2805 [Bacillus sp. OV166]